MLRLTVSLAVVVVLLVGVITTMGRSTTAQEDATAGHPIVGAWRLVNEPSTPEENVSYAIFHADGTYTEAHPYGGTGIGAWTPTGERSADLTIVFQNISQDPNVFEPGIVTVWQALETDETGETFTATGAAEVAAPDGTVVFAGAANTLGTRLQAEPVPEMGTPAAGTPTTAAGAETITVALTEFAIDMPTELAAGPITFQVTNDGTAEHNFEVEGQGIEEELPANLVRGESGTLSPNLAPGTYEVYCPVDDHAGQGMRLELTVTK